MEIDIKPYTVDRIDDVVDFEHDLREQEQFWGWEINEEYLKSVRDSFTDDSFRDSISLLAYVDGKVAFTGMLSDHLSFINIDSRLNEETAAVLKLIHRVSN